MNDEDTNGMIASTGDIRKTIAQMEVDVQEDKTAVKLKLGIVGNIVHDSVPNSNDEAYDVVLSWGEKLTAPKLKGHLSLVELADIEKASMCSEIREEARAHARVMKRMKRK